MSCGGCGGCCGRTAAQIVVATLVLVAQTACLLAGPALLSLGIDKGIYPDRRRRRALNIVAAIAYLVVALLGFVTRPAR